MIGQLLPAYPKLQNFKFFNGKVVVELQCYLNIHPEIFLWQLRLRCIIFIANVDYDVILAKESPFMVTSHQREPMMCILIKKSLLQCKLEHWWRCTGYSWFTQDDLC